MEKSYYILMGDVIKSRNYDGMLLSEELKKLVESINLQVKDETLSPYTITLGDEFQGITASLKSGLKTIFTFEEEKLRLESPFNLHYVLNYGKIDTAINPEIAYGMLGSGLTEARKLLSSKRRERLRFNFSIQNYSKEKILNNLFIILDQVQRKWKQRDYSLILDMIENENDEEVGEKQSMDRSQVFRRRRTLMIDSYQSMKKIAYEIAAN